MEGEVCQKSYCLGGLRVYVCILGITLCTTVHPLGLPCLRYWFNAIERRDNPSDICGRPTSIRKSMTGLELFYETKRVDS